LKLGSTYLHLWSSWDYTSLPPQPHQPKLTFEPRPI
jgi:hypothetical protein